MRTPRLRISQKKTDDFGNVKVGAYDPFCNTEKKLKLKRHSLLQIPNIYKAKRELNLVALSLIDLRQGDKTEKLNIIDTAASSKATGSLKQTLNRLFAQRKRSNLVPGSQALSPSGFSSVAGMNTTAATETFGEVATAQTSKLLSRYTMMTDTKKQRSKISIKLSHSKEQSLNSQLWEKIIEENNTTLDKKSRMFQRQKILELNPSTRNYAKVIYRNNDFSSAVANPHVVMSHSQRTPLYHRINKLQVRGKSLPAQDSCSFSTMGNKTVTSRLMDVVRNNEADRGIFNTARPQSALL